MVSFWVIGEWNSTKSQWRSKLVMEVVKKTIRKDAVKLLNLSRKRGDQWTEKETLDSFFNYRNIYLTSRNSSFFFFYQWIRQWERKVSRGLKLLCSNGTCTLVSTKNRSKLIIPVYICISKKIWMLENSLVNLKLRKRLRNGFISGSIGLTRNSSIQPCSCPRPCFKAAYFCHLLRWTPRKLQKLEKKLFPFQLRAVIENIHFFRFLIFRPNWTRSRHGKRRV